MLQVPEVAPPAPRPAELTEKRAQGASSQRQHIVSLRTVALWAHRYVGLFLTVFLVVAGVTGSLLAFHRELDQLSNPGLYRAEPPAAGAPRLDPFELREALQRQLPAGLHALRVPFEAREGVATLFLVSPAPGAQHDSDDEYFVDPYTGRVLGSRRWGDLSQGLPNLMPFIYRLHYSLALGEVGSTLFGIVALLWTLDCFAGAYLTTPPARAQGRGGLRVWLRRWKPAWLVRGGRLFSWVFTWHRAGGLWVWALLLVFAWSAVGLNLRDVYRPVMEAAFGLNETTFERLPKVRPAQPEPALDWRSAHERGKALMAEEASRRGFQVLRELRLVYQPEVGAFRYQVASSLDVSDRYASTTLWLDATSGERLGFDAPTGENAGRTVTTWIYQLHFASVRGLGTTYRVIVCVLGLWIAGLSITGIWVWWVTRAKRSRRVSAT